MQFLLMGAFDFGALFGNFAENWYLYLALFLVIAGVVFFVIFAKKNDRERVVLTDTARIVYIAAFVALSTVVNAFCTFYPVSYIAITFTFTVCFLAAYFLGAGGGFVVGFTGDLIGAIIFPQGAYNPLIGIASGLTGFIIGIILDYGKGSIYLKCIISAALCLVICTSGINTFALWLMYAAGKKTFWVYLLARLPWQALVMAGNCGLCISLSAILPRITKYIGGGRKSPDYSAEETAETEKAQENDK